MDRKTALYDMHLKYKGNMVSFAGYMLPVHYEKGLTVEHIAVRTKAGLFDVSHMGEISCTGKDALDNLQMLMTNDFNGMVDGQARYSPMCNEMGGIVDDLVVYRKGEDDYFIVVNAANKDKDFAWMHSKQFGDVVFADHSDDYAQIALQGPKSWEIIRKLTEVEHIPKKYYHAVFCSRIGNISCMISRTGYTGEDGFEIYLANDDAAFLWEQLMEAGEEYGILPCGLGARDTLRLEASMPLYGHEMDDTVNPLEAGLGFAVKMEKDDFIGKAAIEEMEELKRKRVGLKILDRGIVRENEEVYLNDSLIGRTTSGTYCPHLRYAAAMALIDSRYAEVGTVVEVPIRKRSLKAEVVAMPFYIKSSGDK